MNLNKYICANILSFIGNIGLFIFLLSSFGNYRIQGKAWMYIEENCSLWAFLIAGIILFLLIEVSIYKISHNKYSISLPTKNEYIKRIYNILFWLGVVCSIIFLLIYICLIFLFIDYIN